MPTNSMIPKIIWQTYKTERPPSLALGNIDSWTSRNPDHEYRYFDDARCQQFMRNCFDEDFYNMYSALPIGVMRADVWRVAVIYVYGGIYADLDTECRASVCEWIDKDDGLVVGVENCTGAIGNFVFAAIPRHPALYAVLQTFVELYNSKSYLNANSPTPVQDFGAGGWSMGILRHYNLFNAESIPKDGGDYNLPAQARQERTKFYSCNSNILSAYPDDRTLVYHQTASVFWTAGYDSWRHEQQSQLGIFGE